MSSRSRFATARHGLRDAARTIIVRTLICCAPLLVPNSAIAEVWETRVVGEHTVVPNEPPDAGQALATIDATLKGVQAVTNRIKDLPAVKALKLTDARVAAYVSGMINVPEPDKVSRDGGTVRSQLTLRIDLDEAARRIDLTAKDAETSGDLIDTWSRIEQLRVKLASDGRQAAGDSALEESRKTAREIQINLWLARAANAMVHVETGTTSIPVVPPDELALAKQLAQKALDLDARNPHAIAMMGDVLLEEGDPEEAEPAFRQAVRNDPKSAIAHNKLGNALYLQGQFNDAVAEFNEAIRLNPSDAISHSDLGDALRAQQNVAGAIAEYREAIRLDPMYVAARHNLGITLAGQRRMPEALQEFQEAVRVRPDSAQAHYNTAIALADLDRDEDSAKSWREAVRLNPNNYNAHYNLAEMLRLIGELKESASEFREYVKRAPDTAATQKNKARAKTFIEAFEEP